MKKKYIRVSDTIASDGYDFFNDHRFPSQENILCARFNRGRFYIVPATYSFTTYSCIRLARERVVP